jgi:hypothetical protein
MPAVASRRFVPDVVRAARRRLRFAARGRRWGLVPILLGLLLIPGIAPSAPLGVGDDPGWTPSDEPALAPDVAGGAFLAWRDSRGEIVVEHVDASGLAIWPGPGLRRGRSPTSPQLAADGAGGALLAWLDAEGPSALRIERRSADGATLWEARVEATAGASAGPTFRITTDGAGGAFLAWEEQGVAGCCSIVAQHLDPQGAATWGEAGGGLALAEAATRGSLAVAEQDPGGLSVAFATGAGGPIVVHRLAPDGQARGAPVVAARAAVTNGALAMAAGPGGGVVLAWATRDPAGVRAQQIDVAGRLAWTDDGAAVTDAAIAPADVRLGVDAQGRATVAWQDARDASADCPGNCLSRLQRIRADGAREWGADGRLPSLPPAFGPRIVATGAGLVAAWQHCASPVCADVSEVRVAGVADATATRAPSEAVGDTPVVARVALVGTADGAIVAWWHCGSGAACRLRTQRVALDALLAAAAPALTGPDLTLTALSGPVQAAPGQTFLVSNTVKNVGDTAAGPFRVGLYLSDDPTTPNGAPIGFRRVVGLAPTGSSVSSTAVTIPNSATDGPTFLVGVVDDLDSVIEGDETNNVRHVPLTIVQPDLVVSAVSAPATGTIGGTLPVSTTIHNARSGMVSATFTVGIYLATNVSANSTFDPAAARRVGSRTISGLGGNGTVGLTTPVTIPSDLVPGSYFLGAFVDEDGVVPELTATNNRRTAAAATAFRVMLTSFTPATGPVGTVVTITGTSLPAVQEVRFLDGIAADGFTLLPPTALRATVPSGATSGKITLAFSGGSVSSTAIFRVTPRIVSFLPAAALLGDTVIVTGTTLAGATVRIGAVLAPVMSSTDSEVVFTVPSPARTGRITVTTTGGTATSAADLIVVRPPVISSFSPTAAPVGATVMINGDQFAAATDVSFFNGVSVGAFTVLSATSIRTVVPGGAVTGPLSVTNPAGSTSSTVFFKVAPRITGFSPPSGLPGANISITGTTFDNATVVRFGGVAAVIVGNTAGEVVVTVPATAPTGRITVVTAAGQSVSPADFLVIRAPTVSALSPAAAAVGGTVIVGGTNLASATAVTFNGVPVDRRVVLSNSALRVTVPLGATTGQVGVTNAAGSATSSAAAPFRVLPAIMDVSPASGLIGDTVTITGTTFTGLVSVRFGAAAAGVVSDSDSEVVVTVPAAGTTGPVTLTTAAGTATSPTAFEVIRPPSGFTFTPGTGPAGTQVTIDGGSVGSATDVMFGGVTATFTRASATRLRATVPLLAVSGSIAITNPAGTGTSGTFRVTPKIISFTPSLGPRGASVAITGSGFVGVPIVRFGLVATSPTSVSPTAVVASVPPGALTGPITVSTTEGSAVSSTPFIVILPPTLTSFIPASGTPGTLVKLVGTSLTGTSLVQFNGIPSANTSANASITTTLTATVPDGATTGRITVTNEAGTVTSAADFRVPPTISGFAPEAGVAGTEVTISGNALNTTTSVAFGGAVATLLSVNASQVVAIVPGTAVTGRITVTTVQGAATSADEFEVLASGAAFRLRRPVSATR